MVVNVSENDFVKEVSKSDVPVVVDFYADWCGPCKMIAPVLLEISEEMSGKVKICKINVDEAVALAQQNNVTSIPTILFYKNGEVVDQIVGAVPKNVIVDKIEKML